MEKTATIRRWTDRGWGIANAFPNERFFVHINNAISEEVGKAFGPGVRISFEVGDPRMPGELPQARKIRLVEQRSKPADSDTGILANDTLEQDGGVR